MSWTLYRWVWILQSPLSIGTTPAGTLNRCRLYIPTRTLWGALTATLARKQSPSSFPNYRKIGNQLRQNFRFTYLFPAKKEGNQWRAWLPKYNSQGLIWKPEGKDQQQADSDRKLRQKLLGTRISTAIDPHNDTAREGTLHEIEHLNIYWRSKSNTTNLHRVAMVGYVLLKSSQQSEFHQDDCLKLRIMVGGDTRYGFGILQCICCTPSTNLFELQIDLHGQHPIVHSNVIYAHAKANTKLLVGKLEVCAGWDTAAGSKLVHFPTLLYAPGSNIPENSANQTARWQIMPNGLWEPL